MSKKSIVILGGGVGGLVIANELSKRLRGRTNITLIDKESRHIFSPSFLWLMLGLRKPENICKNLSLLEKKGVRFLNAEIRQIDIENKRVNTDKEGLNYDYLVISLGAELNPDAVPGFLDSAHNLYTLEGATRIRDTLQEFPGGRVVILVSSMPFKCPAAPYEAAMLIDYYLRNSGLRDKSDIQVYTPEPLPMPVTGPVLGNAVKDMLLFKGIGFNPNTKVKSISNDEIVFEGDKLVPAGFKQGRAGFDLLVGIPVHMASTVVKDSGLLGESEWIPVDKGTLQTRYEDVYAIGDVTGIKLPNGKMLPKAGVFAHFEAEVVAKNIADKIEGNSAAAAFNGRGYCFLEMGYGKSGFASGNFYAEPEPKIEMKKPGRLWHWGKIAFEKWWMWKWF